jgi:hypothetical protein
MLTVNFNGSTGSDFPAFFVAQISPAHVCLSIDFYRLETGEKGGKVHSICKEKQAKHEEMR